MTDNFQTPTETTRAVRSALIAEVCDSDPYIPGLVSGDDRTGPILTTLSARHFDILALLRNDDDNARLDALVKEISSHFPKLEIQVFTTADVDFSRYSKACAALQGVIDALREDEASTHISIALNPGNIRTHAAWMRLMYHNQDVTLLQLDPTSLPSVEGPGISSIDGTFHARHSPGVLQEPVEPMSDESARDMDLVGNHPGFRKAVDNAAEIARFDTPVLIVGEPGSGKTSLAAFIWRSSPRHNLPMQTTAPSDLPDPLATSLLFGNTAGSGKSGNNSTGLLATEAEGTILIENAEKLCEPIQEALAEYLSTGLFRPVGAKENVKSGARLLFTSCDVSDNGPSGLIPRLREILSATTIRLPSLRERREDIPLIALHYLRRINMSLKSARSMPRDMLRVMQQHQWSGNVRELRLAIERAALLSSGGEMHVEDLSIEIDRTQILAQSVSHQTPEIGEEFSLEGYLGEMRRKIILRALELSRGNQSEAARMLHITPQAVHQFLKFQNKATKSRHR
jgi:DNA-binding NtrC family response regulator